MRPTWVLADAHGGADGAADEQLLQLLERARRDVANLLVLGDLFKGWIAIDRFYGSLERQVVEHFTRLRAGGARVEFVVGNRDYLVRENLLGRAFDAVYEEATVIDLAGKKTMVVHGDRTNPDDLFYRAWYRLSRSRGARALIEHIPSALGRRMISGTESKMATTNTRYKTGLLPIPALEALGREGARRGAERVLVGHFHHDRVLDVHQGVPVVLAPGWCDHQRILIAEDSGKLRSVSLAEL